MDYHKFKKLVAGGEKSTVDFKIQCSAFASAGISEKAELAKDICAMCNNGNVASYIIVGVSDDGRQFKSVANKNLTDDRLQAFCRTAITPPPKVSLYRKRWSRTLPRHQGVEFVIIEIGPHRRQAFYLARDFIEYESRVCFKHHEAWIRRNATSDLPTPQEVARLVQGQPLHEDDHAEIRAARSSFNAAAEKERSRLVNAETEAALERRGYKKLPDGDWWRAVPALGGGTYAVPTFHKQIGGTALLVGRLGCAPSLTRRDLGRLMFNGYFPDEFVDWRKVPSRLAKLTRRRVKAVRRLCFLPVLGHVPVGRISSAFPNARKLGAFRHYYRHDLRAFGGSEGKIFVKSSSEFLVLDSIRSVVEYGHAMEAALMGAESDETPTVTPPASDEVGQERSPPSPKF